MIFVKWNENGFLMGDERSFNASLRFLCLLTHLRSSAIAWAASCTVITPCPPLALLVAPRPVRPFLKAFAAD